MDGIQSNLDGEIGDGDNNRCCANNLANRPYRIPVHGFFQTRFGLRLPEHARIANVAFGRADEGCGNQMDPTKAATSGQTPGCVSGTLWPPSNSTTRGVLGNSLSNAFDSAAGTIRSVGE